MSDAYIFNVSPENAGDRLDKFVSDSAEGLSRSAACLLYTSDAADEL